MQLGHVYLGVVSLDEVDQPDQLGSESVGVASVASSALADPQLTQLAWVVAQWW